MSNLVLKNKSSKKEIIIFISVFIIGLISRIGFGLFNTTGDLTWYVDPSLDEFGYPQLTRFGFHKEILFLPLQLFKSINLRICIVHKILYNFVGLMNYQNMMVKEILE